MVEQTNQSEHSFVKGEHLNGGKTGQTCIQDYSYDKDVVEIKLPDTVLSADYGGHFIKDVCIDEGVLPDKKTSKENQVSSNDCHETGIGVASETNNIIHSDLPVESAAADFSVVIPEEVAIGTALDKGGSIQVNHYNPFIAYGPLDEIWEPNYSLPTIVDATSIAPICPVEKTDSFSDLVNRTLEGFDPINIDEAIIEENRTNSVEASSATLDVQASEQLNDQRENPSDDVNTDVVHENGIATSLSTSNGEPNDVKSENGKKCEIDSARDINDFNPRDVEVGTKRSEDIMDSKSSPLVQTESVVQQNGPDSAKVTAQTVIRNPFESSFSGPSITSGPLTPSGHIPYSGNISLRSESSTTSTRSFAFPV
nr:unnamed protein product [Digitaria exilis]